MRYLLYLPGIILLLIPLLGQALADKQAAEAQREKEAAAEQRRIEAEAKKAEKAAKAAERERIRAAKEAERQRKLDERLEAARKLAEYAERELAAKQAAKALDMAMAETTPEEHSETTAPSDAQGFSEVMAQYDRHMDCAEERPETVHDANPDTEPTQPDTEPTQPDAEPTQPDSKPTMPKITGNNAFRGHVVAFTGRLPGMTRAEAIQAVQSNGGRAYTKMPAGTTLLVVGDKPGMCKMDKADEWIGQVRKITAAQFFEMLAQPLTLEPEELEAMFAARFAA